MSETYHWAGRDFDITKLLGDVRTGKIRPKSDVIDKDFVTRFASSVLGLVKAKGPDQEPKMIFGTVDAKYAFELDAQALINPVIMLHVGKNKGILNLGQADGAAFVIADGNHRIAKAFFVEHADPLPVLVLSRAQTLKYLM